MKHLSKGTSLFAAICFLASTVVGGAASAGESNTFQTQDANTRIVNGETAQYIEVGEDGFDITIIPNNSGIGSRVTPINCKGKYDYPHASTESGKKTVNAHLIASCSGGQASETRIHVQSRMTDGYRLGAVSSRVKNPGSENLEVRTGGDLACITTPRSYQALGTVTITYPPGYDRSVDQYGLVSQVRSFVKGSDGKCS